MFYSKYYYFKFTTMQNFKCSFLLSFNCLFVTLVFVTFEVAAYAPKEGNVNALFGPYIYKTHFKSTDTAVNSPVLANLGVIINGDISHRGALEIAIFHLNKNYYREQVSQYIAEQTELLHITMGYRRWLNPHFSISAAFFSAYSMGEVKVLHNDFPIDKTIDTSARDTTEYGFDLSAQAELWQKDRLSLILDTRYSLSATAKPNEKSDHYGFMLGLKYFIQSKQVAKHAEQ